MLEKNDLYRFEVAAVVDLRKAELVGAAVRPYPASYDDFLSGILIRVHIELSQLYILHHLFSFD